jgi:hypothetical protein
VGYNRVYARVDGELAWDKWWNSVRSGRVFVSNGPLLRVRADGQWPGHVFRFPLGKSTTIQLGGRLDSRDAVPAIEIIWNGETVKRIPAERFADGTWSDTISVSEPGWFLVRAIAAVPETFRMASTGPFFVEQDGQVPRVSRRAARFFLDWVRERMQQLRLEDPRQREAVLKYQREAEQFWQQRVEEATCE